MSNSGINFKVYYMRGDFTEVKRFFVDADAVTSFVFMKEKLKSVFPNLSAGDFRITWKDTEGDHISISNDEDFITALTEMNDNPKVLYVNAEYKGFSEETPRQFQVFCDVCQKGITGYRYKCIECHDYDLCATCEGNGHHSEHMVLRLPNSSTPVAKLDRKMMFNAARALKKSAVVTAKEAHRCAREAFKGNDKDKSSRQEGTSGQNVSEGCPFSANIGDIITQNLSALRKNPFIENLARDASNVENTQDGAGPKTIADLLNSVAEAFSTLVNPEANASASTQVPTSMTSQAAQGAGNRKSGEQTPIQKPTQNLQPTNQNTQQPAQTNVENATSGNNQDMEWTIVSDKEDSNSQASVSSQTLTTQPPPLPQDPRLMRGLAQLYEMGFSNENNFLNYMLEAHNYNVGDVVKAILQMK
ncbi:hypothetical protein HHI36_012052 [Cryptolaemus montrouzieri]|uniref:ZZ-type domain-containing protein n=1 Tax=Cryptolaemus montrouzieri TaxID=559131 RepID=A0ABD2NDC7_9CUCU